MRGYIGNAKKKKKKEKKKNKKAVERDPEEENIFQLHDYIPAL